MNMNKNVLPAGALPVNLDNLSKGVDRILDRWEGGGRPTKLTLLNDLAASISPGSNWGALKAKLSKPQSLYPQMNTKFVPAIDYDADELPARLTEVKRDENKMTFADLTTEIRPLFGMHHAGDPIIGLELSVAEGNGYSEASIYAKLIVSKDGRLDARGVYASDLEPKIAQLIYNAVQNLDSIELYPTMAQCDCRSLRILLGPFDCVISIPEYYGRVPDENFASQGLRVLLDEGGTPSITDLDMALRLASATVALLDPDQYSTLTAVRFKLSQPLMQVWKPVDFTAPDHLDERPMFWIPNGKYWAHQDDYISDHNIWTHRTLGEPLDLALALVDVDDPDVYLKVALSPMPKSLRRSGKLKENWRGGFDSAFQVFRIKPSEPTLELDLTGAIKERFETGFIGWATHEGHEIVADKSRFKTEALIRRDTRRASHHLSQVEAIMNGVDPKEKELLKDIREGK